MTSLKRIIVPLFILALITAGCKKDLDAFSPSVSNNVDTFTFQASDVKRLKDEVEYTWGCTGSMAGITNSSSISKGTATLILRDANGSEVYNGDLSGFTGAASNSGTAGQWTIRLEFTKVQGTLDFAVVKL